MSVSKKQNTLEPIQLYTLNPIQDEVEISLNEVIAIILNRKKLIFIITLTCFLSSLLFVNFFLPNKWKIDTLLMPPLLNNVQGMNNFKLGQFGYSPEVVFKRFLTNYQSSTQKNIFIKKNKLEASTLLIILPPITNSINSIQASMQIETLVDSNTQNKLDEFQNQYLQIVSDYTIKDITNEIKVIINNLDKELNEKIEGMLNVAKRQRMDRIIALDDAIKIAKTLNFKNVQLMVFNIDGDVKTKNSLYLLGYQALEAERQLLENRKDDSPFINGLRELQEQKRRLSGQLEYLSKGNNNFSVVNFEKVTENQVYQIKHKTKLIIVMGTFLGLILSLILIFVLNLVDKYKKTCE